jgi:hypothetical protein
MLASIALAADNGFRLFIVMTSDNTWLYDQTLVRTRGSLAGLRTLSKDELPQLSATRSLLPIIANAGLIITITKNISVLNKLLDQIGSIPTSIPTVIYDDEADQASLDTLVNRLTEDKSAINGAISLLRNYFTTMTYVQITATPQSLLLQNVDGDFRPSFTVTFSPGDNYVGSDLFFGANGDKYIRQIPEVEIPQIIGSPSVNGLEDVPGLRSALCTFFSAAAIKLLRPTNDPATFTFLGHISQRQNDHLSLKSRVDTFVQTLISTLLAPKDFPEEYQELLGYFQEAYNDLAKTASHIPTFDELLEEISANVASTRVQVLMASPASNMPDFDVPFNLLIGGNRLGRGVTIPRLLVTYYGRQVRAPQIDTIMQHARMYGYRGHDVDVTRCFLTDDLRSIFSDIHDSNAALLSLLTQGSATQIKPILLSRSGNSALRATRNNVVDANSISTYLPGTAYFPRVPESANLAAIDTLLRPYESGEQPKIVPLDFVINLLGLTRSDSTQWNGTWDDEAIRVCLRDLINAGTTQAALVVRWNRNTSFPYRALLSSDDSRRFVSSLPTLTMYRENAGASLGWLGDDPVWVPNLRFPDRAAPYIFTTS